MQLLVFLNGLRLISAKPVGRCQRKRRRCGRKAAFIDIRWMFSQFIADKSARIVMSRIRFIGTDHVISCRCASVSRIFPWHIMLNSQNR